MSVVAGTFGITTVGAPDELSDPLAVIIALRTIRTARTLASGATADAYGTVQFDLDSDYVDENGAKGFLTVTSSVFCVEQPYDMAIHVLANLEVGAYNSYPGHNGGFIVYVDANPVYSVITPYGSWDVDETVTNTISQGQHTLKVLVYNELRFESGSSSYGTVTITPTSPP